MVEIFGAMVVMPAKDSGMATLDIESMYPGQIIAGVDEVGRGALVGPVVAASVIIDQMNLIPGIKDSKKLSPKKRESLYALITNNYSYAVGIIEHDEIDRINILEATKIACSIAVKNLKCVPDVVIIDGNMKFADARFISIVGGDALSMSIAASSIVAKVTRDRILRELHQKHPEYLWDKNVGYGTKEHLKAIDIYGFSPYHRKSFKVII